ncbi:MAG: tetratricopeptide repeat protein [Thermoleophilia bacterium]
MDRLEFFARAVADEPDEPRARFGYAVALRAAGRTDEAVEQFRAYLGLTTDEGNGWQRLGEALAELGRADEAADAYLAGIDAALAHGHTGMAQDLQDLLEAL